MKGHFAHFNKIPDKYKMIESSIRKIKKDLVSKHEVKLNKSIFDDVISTKSIISTIVQPHIATPITVNNKYFLKMLNLNNACYANVIIQALLSLGNYFFQKVFLNLT